MERISEITKEQLKSRSARTTAITLIPATLFAGYIYSVFARIFISFSANFSAESLSLFGAMTVFFAGVCLDQTAHIICCCKGSRAGLIMRVCATVTELTGVVWWVFLLFSLIPDMTDWRNLLAASESMVLLVPLVLFHLLIILWKTLEAISLIQFVRCLSDNFKGKRVLRFGSASIVSAMGFIVIAFLLTLLYVQFFDADTPSSLLIYGGVMLLGFSSVPAYIFALSAQSFKMADALDGSEDKQ